MEDGYHAEIFFLFTEDGAMIILTVQERDPKARAWMVRKVIKDENIYGLVHVAQAWMHRQTEPGDHTTRQIWDGEIKVSELRDEDKSEVLAVTMQSRDGDSCAWATPILKNNERGKLTLGKSELLSAQGGRFLHLFE